MNAIGGGVRSQHLEASPGGGGEVPVVAHVHPEAPGRVVPLEGDDGEPVGLAQHEARHDRQPEARLDVALEHAPSADLDDGVDGDAERFGGGLAELAAVGLGGGDDGGEVGGLARGHRGAPCKRMAGRGDEHHAVGAELVVAEGLLRVALAGADREVHLVVEQAPESLAHRRCVEAHGDVGVRVAKALQVRGQDERRARGARGDAHAVGRREVEMAGEVVEQAVGVAHQRVCERVEPLARRGRLDACARAHEQRLAELVLEVAHLERHRGLGAPEVLGRARDGAVAQRFAKRPHLPEAVALVADGRGAHRCASPPGGSARAASRKCRAASGISRSRRTATP